MSSENNTSSQSTLNETHDPALTSWVESANEATEQRDEQRVPNV